MLIDDMEYRIQEKLSNYYVTHMTLIIENFQPHHAGKYYCNAKNSIGEVAGHIVVNGNIFFEGNIISFLITNLF